LKQSASSQNSFSSQFSCSILEASFIGHSAYARLKNGEEGTVHGVFDKAINILLSGGLVSLVPETVQKGPLNVILRMPVGQTRMSGLGVSAGDKVKVHDVALELSDHILISLGSGRIYSPRQKFTLPILSNDEIEANIEVMRKIALLFGNMAGLGQLLALKPYEAAITSVKNLNIFASSALRRIVRFEQAFCSEERNSLKDSVSELIGLGPGLTPSSDDMLAGLVLLCVLYGQNSGCAQHACRLAAKLVAEEAHGRTTLLSEEYLKQAALGRGNEQAIRLCTAVLTGSRKSVERETRRMLEIGESSGTDTVLGIVIGATLCLNKQLSLERREFK
jgi:hypothetical protein